MLSHGNNYVDSRINDLVHLQVYHALGLGYPFKSVLKYSLLIGSVEEEVASSKQCRAATHTQMSGALLPTLDPG